MDHVPTYLKIFAEDDAECESSQDESQIEERGGWGNLQLHGYEVEEFEEPCLFSGLVTLQLGIFRAFLVRVKGAPEVFAREYFGLLDEVDGRVLKLGRFCSASCEV